MKEKIELTNLDDDFFHHFNSFIMSNDKRVFSKLIARAFLYSQVKNIPGDIVECGVFRGSGLYTFLKLKRILNPNTYKKVIGFDYYNTEALLSEIKNQDDKAVMTTLFEDRNFHHSLNFKEKLELEILNSGFEKHEFLLVEGDISKTSKEFSEQNPGMRISLMYMDLDLEEPTYNTLTNLWNKVSTGGIVIFDEYGYHVWSESNGVDRFIKEKGLELISLDYMCPTAYIIKK